MPDLHAWISQQVDAREALARRAVKIVGDWTYVPELQRILDRDYVIANTGSAYGQHIAANGPAAVLRRCAADRKILERHSVDPALADDRLWATACNGCGSEGDCWDPATENINDCPELLDLAWAHGMSAAIIATLDRPQSPEWPPAPRRPVPTSAVPAALRGPNWKDRP